MIDVDEVPCCRGTVHWEWFYGWHTTFAHYFPKYLLEEDPCINSFFATNVPYNFPTDVVWEDTYKVRVRVVTVEQLQHVQPRCWTPGCSCSSQESGGAPILAEPRPSQVSSATYLDCSVLIPSLHM